MKDLIVKTKDGLSIFYCPACKQSHGINDSWKISYDGGLPTVIPSVKVSGWRMPENPEFNEDGSYKRGDNGRVLGAWKHICHLFVKSGRIQYLNDCTHDMKGMTVDMEPV